MVSVNEKKNLHTLIGKANKLNRKGKIYRYIAIFFMVILGIEIIASPFMGLGGDIFISIIPMIIMFGLFYLLFRHGKAVQNKAIAFSNEAQALNEEINSEVLPTLEYDDGKILHTHFIVEIPFMTNIEIDGKLLKIKSDRMTQRNTETTINLADVSNIKFKDVSLTPGYIGFETPSHSISKADFKTDSNTIPFAGAEVKKYILELKAYTEYLINNK